MPNHKSPKKSLRSDKVKAERNRYQLKTCKTFIKSMKKAKEDKDVFFLMLKDAVSKIDKLAKKNIIHKNTASRRKSLLYSRYNAMA